ncbi:YybH family protein [Variovorax ginsengisoli]|uniref:Ketosteroid isomerase-like protein/predicted negative regulator of RcsB-dependent stress response n=1 Tax=Variovorax ginsengisoli TaxID=363844 RepID=A0ABT9SFZ9_9BURK|nr:nuclear transport factor 2 family protein [Variovorax ginsengisoli]MDP9902718.1 ketosteroid isomerase-like protein/predicted negative regulator of RcsB-dependent stress response [Variovorax ginsengisoli]
MNSLRAPLVKPLCAMALTLACMAPATASDYDDVDRLTQAGKLDEALVRADKFLANNPRDPQMRFLKGVAQIDAGKSADAIATFTRLTQDAPELPEPYNNLAVIYASQGQYDKARSTLESAIRTNPSYSTAHENLGDVYARLASQAYSKALQLDQGNTAVAPKLAVIRTLVSPTTAGTATNVARGAKDRTVVAAAPAPAPAPVAPAVTPAAPAAKAAAPAAVAAAPLAAPRPAAAPLTPAPVPSAAAPAPVADKAGAPTGEVESAVRAWAGAWAAQEMDDYLAAYGPDFTPAGGQSRKAWEEERRARIVGKSNISVAVSNLAITFNGDTAIAKFRQSYRADSLNINSRKTLELTRHQGRWRIVKEAVGG